MFLNNVLPCYVDMYTVQYYSCVRARINYLSLNKPKYNLLFPIYYFEQHNIYSALFYKKSRYLIAGKLAARINKGCDIGSI